VATVDSTAVFVSGEAQRVALGVANSTGAVTIDRRNVLNRRRRKRVSTRAPLAFCPRQFGIAPVDAFRLPAVQGVLKNIIERSVYRILLVHVSF
jgi:hypothetical protein